LGTIIYPFCIIRQFISPLPILQNKIKNSQNKKTNKTNNNKMSHSTPNQQQNGFSSSKFNLGPTHVISGGTSLTITHPTANSNPTFAQIPTNLAHSIATLQKQTAHNNHNNHNHLHHLNPHHIHNTNNTLGNNYYATPTNTSSALMSSTGLPNPFNINEGNSNSNINHNNNNNNNNNTNNFNLLGNKNYKDGYFGSLGQSGVMSSHQPLSGLTSSINIGSNNLHGNSNSNNIHNDNNNNNNNNQNGWFPSHSITNSIQQSYKAGNNNNNNNNNGSYFDSTLIGGGGKIGPRIVQNGRNNNNNNNNDPNDQSLSSLIPGNLHQQLSLVLNRQFAPQNSNYQEDIDDVLFDGDDNYLDGSDPLSRNFIDDQQLQQQIHHNNNQQQQQQQQQQQRNGQNNNKQNQCDNDGNPKRHRQQQYGDANDYGDTNSTGKNKKQRTQNDTITQNNNNNNNEIDSATITRTPSQTINSSSPPTTADSTTQTANTSPQSNTINNPTAAATTAATTTTILQKAYSNGEESIATSGDQIIVYAPASKTYLAQVSVPVLIERVKAVLLRDNLKQKDLAQYVGISGSTLSPLLKHKYMHTKVQHMQTLIEWLLSRDKDFVSMVNSRIRLLAIESSFIISKLNLSLEQWQSWLKLEDIRVDRSIVDKDIGLLITALTQSRMGIDNNMDDDDHHHGNNINNNNNNNNNNSNSINNNNNNNNFNSNLADNGQVYVAADDDLPDTSMDQHFTPVNNNNNNDPKNNMNNIQIKNELVSNAFPSLPRNLLRSVARIIGDLKARPHGSEPTPSLFASLKSSGDVSDHIGGSGKGKRTSSGKSSGGKTSGGKRR
jgi:transcriptional regulator with XRE-family HTH domain